MIGEMASGDVGVQHDCGAGGNGGNGGTRVNSDSGASEQLIRSR